MSRIPGFHPSIDLFDETLREGAERAPLATSIEAKCGLAKAITSAGTRTLVVGMFPDVPHNIELLGALLDLRERGELPQSARFVIISYLGVRMEQTLRILDDLGARPREVEGERWHVSAEVVDIENQLFGKVLLFAPQSPANTQRGKTKLMPGGINGFHPGQTEVP